VFQFVWMEKDLRCPLCIISCTGGNLNLTCSKLTFNEQAGYRLTRVWFLDSAGHFRCNWSWNPFYGHSHRAYALVLYRSFSSLLKWRQQVLVNCLTVCPGTMRWLNCALVNSMRLTVVIWSENYQHHYHHPHMLELRLISGYRSTTITADYEGCMGVSLIKPKTGCYADVKRNGLVCISTRKKCFWHVYSCAYWLVQQKLCLCLISGSWWTRNCRNPQKRSRCKLLVSSCIKRLFFSQTLFAILRLGKMVLHDHAYILMCHRLCYTNKV
jgi:hypothetical protein